MKRITQTAKETTTMTKQYCFYDNHGYPTKLESEFINGKEVASRSTTYLQMGALLQKWDTSIEGPKAAQ
jgi:hypothetical protein